VTEYAARIVSLTLHTTTDADTETLWDCLVDDIDSWWGEPYVNSPERTSLTLDARPGGLLFEDWGDGNGTIWATVKAIRKPRQIDFDGTFMMYGALQGFVHIVIDTDDDDRTRITLSQQAIGAVTDETIEAWTTGWKHLLGALTTHAETR